MTIVFVERAQSNDSHFIPSNDSHSIAYVYSHFGSTAFSQPLGSTSKKSMTKKKTFSLALTAPGNNKKSKTSPVPKVCDLTRCVEQIPFQAPPDIVNQFKGTQVVFAFDIETHDIIRENASAWLCGHHGFPTRVSQSTMKSLRVIQIGWASRTNSTYDTR